jgi:exopolysaccharide biosynthesis polyprenyl glycosylphosphotransferase
VLPSRDKPSLTRSSYVEPDALSKPAEYAAPTLEHRLLRRSPLRHEANLAIACFVSDVVALAVAILLDLMTPDGTAAHPHSPLWLLVFASLALILFAVRGAYAPRLRLRLLEDLRGVLSVTAIAAMAVISTRVLIGADQDVAPETAYFWALATLLLGAGRTTLLRTEARARRRGEVAVPTLILGAGRMAHVTARRLLAEPELGLKPIGFLDADPLTIEDRDSVGLPVFGAIPDLERIVSEHGVQHVIVTFSKVPHEVLLDAVRQARELRLAVSILPRLFEIEGERVVVERLGSLSLVAIESSNPRGWQFKLKYAVERMIAALSLLIALPLLTVAAAAVKLTMGGPVLFRQRRVGADGREFDMVKLRTMKGRPEEAEEADIDWALEQLATSGTADDLIDARRESRELHDRRTRVGRLLRRFSMDELPQLWNVVRGEMSLVGPRPERVRYVKSFETSIYRYSDRHRAKSGITGWAQVNGLRGKTSLSDRVEWDNYYIENWSPWLDLKIILMTVACVLRGKHEEREWE